MNYYGNSPQTVHDAYQEIQRRGNGGYLPGAHLGGWHDGHQQVQGSGGYGYRSPASYDASYGQRYRDARFPTPEPMARFNSASAYSGHHPPHHNPHHHHHQTRRSLTPFPGRGHSAPPPASHHSNSQQGSHLSLPDLNRYPGPASGFGRMAPEMSRHHRGGGADWPAQTHVHIEGFRTPYEQRYHAHAHAVGIPGRREGSWVNGQPPMAMGDAAYPMNSNQQQQWQAGGPMMEGGVYQPQRTFHHAYQEEYDGDDDDDEDWEETIHDARTPRGRYGKGREGVVGFQFPDEDHDRDGYESSVHGGHGYGHGHGQGPALKTAEWSRRRGRVGVGYGGGVEEDSGYGSDEGESLVSEDRWDGVEHDRHGGHAGYRQHTPHPGWNKQRMSSAPWPSVPGEGYRQHGAPGWGAGTSRVRDVHVRVDDWR